MPLLEVQIKSRGQDEGLAAALELAHEPRRVRLRVRRQLARTVELPAAPGLRALMRPAIKPADDGDNEVTTA